VDRILRFLQEHEEEMLEDLRLFVEQETPSTEKKLLDDFARFLADYAATVGGRAEILPAVGSGNHVRIRWDDEGSGPPIFLLGHYDTVCGPREPSKRCRSVFEATSRPGPASST
jgi:glutamate carboxypeptidase